MVEESLSSCASRIEQFLLILKMLGVIIVALKLRFFLVKNYYEGVRINESKHGLKTEHQIRE